MQYPQGGQGPGGYGPPGGQGAPQGQPGGYGQPGYPHTPSYGPPPGYPAPQKPKGPSLGLVIVICVIGAMVVVPFVIGAVIGFSRYSDRAKPQDPAKIKLSEHYDTPNGLMTAHYPPDFAAKKIDNVTILVSRRVGTGDEFVTLGAIPVEKAVTDDIEEFARLMLVSVEKNVDAKGGSSTRGKRRDAKCLGKYDGVEYEPTFNLPIVGDYVGKACFFEYQKRMHIVRYDVIKTYATRDTPLLEKIVDATDLAD